MTDEKISFAQLERLLLRLGFRSFMTTKGYRAIADESSGTLFLLPNYDDDALVAWYHLATVRRMLDERGLMTRADFDRFATATTATA